MNAIDSFGVAVAGRVLYRLPDGRTLALAYDLCHGDLTTTFSEKDGHVVTAWREPGIWKPCRLCYRYHDRIVFLNPNHVCPVCACKVSL